jgi:hypothetical protein
VKRFGWVLVGMAVLLAGTESHAAGGNFGLGIIVGEPTGVSGKLFVSNTNAIDGAVAWSFGSDTEFHLQMDYLYHFRGVIKVDSGKAPIFAGLGGRFKIRDGADNKFGVRIPVGIAYHFEDAPFDIFIEAVPVLELSPSTDFVMEGAIGGRFYF